MQAINNISQPSNTKSIIPNSIKLNIKPIVIVAAATFVALGPILHLLAGIGVAAALAMSILSLAAMIGATIYSPNYESSLMEEINKENPDLNLINQILKHKTIDPDYVDPVSKRGFLHSAILTNNVDVVKTLLTHDDINPNITDNQGLPLLWEPIQNGQNEIAVAIIESGKLALDYNHNHSLQIIRPENRNSPEGFSYLHYAIAVQPNMDIIRSLVNQGSDLNKTDALGRTPLNLAREFHREEVVTFLEDRA